MVSLVLYFLLIAGLVIADQLTKLYFLSLGGGFDIPVLGNFLHFTYCENRGAAFGILQDARPVLITVTILMVAGCAYLLIARKFHSVFADIALSLILAGGIGNLIDRIFRGYVVDFIYVKIINFAVFNLADSYVCVGAALVCVYILFFGKSSKKESVLK